MTSQSHYPSSRIVSRCDTASAPPPVLWSPVRPRASTSVLSWTRVSPLECAARPEDGGCGHGWCDDSAASDTTSDGDEDDWTSDACSTCSGDSDVAHYIEEGAELLSGLASPWTPTPRARSWSADADTMMHPAPATPATPDTRRVLAGRWCDPSTPDEGKA